MILGDRFWGGIRDDALLRLTHPTLVLVGFGWVDLEGWGMPIVPDDFLAGVRAVVPHAGPYFASLLYDTGRCDGLGLAGWMDPERFVRKVPEGVGAMADRLYEAIDRGDRITVWGDGSADGVMTTAVLVEGLGWLGDRIDAVLGDDLGGGLGDGLNAKDDAFVIAYDNADHDSIGNSNPGFLHARFLYLDPYSDAMDGLAGVAIAFKLLERLEQLNIKVPLIKGDLGGSSLSELLDLVAIGLLADPAIAMTGEHRYLVQKGIPVLQRQEDPKTSTRPGIQRMLEHCKEQGDRATDSAMGIGSRIAAMSRIQVDGRLVVELLLSRNRDRARELATLAELAHVRRRGLQREVMDEVMVQVRQLDLSLVPAIVLGDPQWEVGVLGYVAEDLVEIYDRPVLLFNTAKGLARGVARAGGRIDFRALLRSNRGLACRMSGNPYAVDLVINGENLALFTDSMIHHFNRLQTHVQTQNHDLCVTVSELNQALFNDLKLLEPFGRCNPIPKLLVKNVWFEEVRNQKLRDRNNQVVNYIRSTFRLCDDTHREGIWGAWWGHYAEDIPVGRADAIVHLVNNRRAKQYEVQLIGFWPKKEDDLRSIDALNPPMPSVLPSSIAPTDLITTLIGMAKYAARTGHPMPPLTIPKSCHPIALQALENLGFQILQSHPPILLIHPLLYGRRIPRPPLDRPPLPNFNSSPPNSSPSNSPPPDRPSKTAISDATRPLLLALQEAQFQEQFRFQNPER